jgi:hypothetical protein
MVQEAHVVGVEYRSVPEGTEGYDHCEEIFHPCVQ